ncbi:MAG: hypothetical protein DK841_05345 [Candidatus Melainabacteria bacterium]|nr:MAG: hypothetical protein DK841_05345 [Candidatus Melainabacteria bacterium]
MTITNIISAIGNNSSIYPLLVRDCCIEAPSKILIARRENSKESQIKANDATREKIIDEYATSAIWLGGIPAVEKLADKYISKKGYNPNVNIKLFGEGKKDGSSLVQGIEYNIKKFSQYSNKDVQDAVADLIKVRDNKAVYEKFLTKKFAAATIIPTLIMGFVLPKLNFALTRKVKENRNTQLPLNAPTKSFTSLNRTKFSDFYEKQNKDIVFTGGLTSTIASLRTVDKMAISDGGLTVGRVSTSRNKEEGYANAFRMIGSMILNFVTPVYIAKGLDKLANKLFKINVNLDPLILDNEEFISTIKENKIELPKSNSPKDLMDFIDSKPNSLFSKFAQKMKKVSYLKSGIRDPRKFVDMNDLSDFKTEFESFIDSARASKNIEKFAKRAKYVKCANILANVGISSFLLAGVLPAATYKFIKLTTGSYSDPGLK